MSIAERMSAIHIDPTAANNRGDGSTPGTAWRDWEELARRFGRGTWVFRQPTSITIHGDLPATDPVYFPSALLAYGGQLTVQGSAATVLATGTINTFTAFSAAGQTLDTITVNWTTGGSSFAPYVQKFMRIVGGPRAGVTWGIARDMGSSTAEISNPGVSAPSASPLQMVYGFTRTVPVAGDSFEIISLPSAHCGDMTFSLGTTMNTSVALGSVLLTGLSLRWSDTVHLLDNFVPTAIRAGSTVVNVVRCELIAFSVAAQQLLAAQNIFTDGRVVAGSGSMIFRANLQSRGFGASGAHHFALYGASAQLLSGEVLEGSGLTVASGGQVTISSLRLSRAPFGVNLQPSASVSFGSDVWGTDNGGNGILVKSQARAQYSSVTAPTINAGLGSGREVRLGDRDVLYADLPMTSRGASMEFTAT